MVELSLEDHNIRDAVDIIDRFILENDIEQENAKRLKVIYEELITNIFKYALRLGARYVEIKIKQKNNYVLLCLEYDGEAFDPTEYKARIGTDLGDMQIGGLGLFLVGKLSKTFKYERKDNKNVITVTV